MGLLFLICIKYIAPNVHFVKTHFLHTNHEKIKNNSHLQLFSCFHLFSMCFCYFQNVFGWHPPPPVAESARLPFQAASKRNSLTLPCWGRLHPQPASQPASPDIPLPSQPTSQPASQSVCSFPPPSQPASQTLPLQPTNGYSL